MKKKGIILAAATAVVMSLPAVSCSSSTKSDTDTAAEVNVTEDETTLPVAPTDTLTALFTDASKASAQATDSTYATTESGLKYIVVREGTGKSPKATDMVTVHYAGQLLDGTEFDSSYKRGEPTGFPLNRVIAGWTEGLQLMKEGGKTIFYIPSNLAYGEMGTPGGPIGPNQDLIFTVELIKVGE